MKKIIILMIVVSTLLISREIKVNKYKSNKEDERVAKLEFIRHNVDKEEEQEEEKIETEGKEELIIPKKIQKKK